MTRVLPSVLSGDDLPDAELQAARLDGEVFAVEDCFAPIDVVDQASLRGGVLRARYPARLIAERSSAAWVHGALLVAPLRHELCVDIGARYRAPNDYRVSVREVVLADDDVVVRGPMRVTSTLRTAVDLARFEGAFGRVEAGAVHSLAEIGGFGLSDLLGALAARPHLPGKRRAIERLESVLSPSRARECPGQPPLTR